MAVNMRRKKTLRQKPTGDKRGSNFLQRKLRSQMAYWTALLNIQELIPKCFGGQCNMQVKTYRKRKDKYRTISLTNTNAEIFQQNNSKANREHSIKREMYHDQVGFISDVKSWFHTGIKIKQCTLRNYSEIAYKYLNRHGKFSIKFSIYDFYKS